MTPTPDPHGAIGPVRVVDGHATSFPPALRDIADPPAQLWVVGSVPHPPAVAVVGTRTPTALGLAVTARLVRALAGRGAGIVAGLSPGIDRAAHAAALDQGTPTWAFVGGSPDLRGTSIDRDLAGRIIDAGGGVLAEVPPGAPDTEEGRERRDRLQTGVSALTIIVQSDLASGTRHTARAAIAQSRQLGVVRPPASEVDDPSWALNLELLSDASIVINPRRPGNDLATVVL